MMATTAVITIALLIGVLIFTAIQISRTRAARRQQERPFVIVDVFGARTVLFRMEIKNVGKTVARDVSLVFEPELKSTLDDDNRRVRNVPILARGTPSLAPGRSHTLLLDKVPDRAQSELPNEYDVTVSYASFDGHKYTEQQVVDLGVHYSTPDLREHDLHDIWDELDRMRRSLHGIHSALSLMAGPPVPGATRISGPMEPQSGQFTPRSADGSPRPADEEGTSEE